MKSKKKNLIRFVLEEIKPLFIDQSAWQVYATVNLKTKEIQICADYNGDSVLNIKVFGGLSVSLSSIVIHRYLLNWIPNKSLPNSILSISEDDSVVAIEVGNMKYLKALFYQLPCINAIASKITFMTTLSTDEKLVLWLVDKKLQWKQNNDFLYIGTTSDITVFVDLENRYTKIRLLNGKLDILCRIKKEYLSKIIPELKQFEEKVFPVGITDCIIRGSDYQCIIKHHSIEAIDGLICVIEEGQVVEEGISLSYCKTCSKYYISEYEFQRIKRKGIICCQIVTGNQEEVSETSTGHLNLSQKSILMNYGYSVDSRFDTPSIERHRLLAFLVENEIMSAVELKAFIEWLISFNGSKINMSTAVSKWKDDLEYIRTYNRTDLKLRVSKMYRISKKKVGSTQ